MEQFVELCVSYLDRNKNEVILNVWLCWLILESARLPELRRSVSVVSRMSHHD